MKETILKQISDITAGLISTGLSVQQNFPSINNQSIYISGKHELSVMLKNIPYNEAYTILDQEKNYNIKMIDGALIQLMYFFDGNELKKHRLAFFPSPDLYEFQNDSELYDNDDIYADIIAKNIIPTSIRFDYDPDNHALVSHPKSHLTIGQYKNCRIPVCAPITPNIFIDFILRSFYNTALRTHETELSLDNSNLFKKSIFDEEQKTLHLSLWTTADSIDAT